MSKLCDIYWRQRVMGHWQYILYVNTILFVLHCIISLCSFMIPVRIQSFFFFFLATFDLQRILFEQCVFLWRKKEKKKNLLFPLHCDGELAQRRFEMPSVCRRTIDSGSDSTSGSLPGRRAAGGEEVQRSPLGRNPPPLNLWLTVAYFDPLSDE